MSDKKRKWEIEYEKWEKGDYDDKLNDLIAIYERGEVNVEEWKGEDKLTSDDVKRIEEEAKNKKNEYKEYKKMKGIKENLSKVKNIMELKDKLNEEKEKVTKEIERRKTVKELDKERIEIEVKYDELMEEAKEIDKKLKEEGLTKDKRTELENKKEENKKKRDENSEEYKKNQDNMKNKGIPEEGNELIKKDDEELEAESITLSTKISKCNMACNSLMQGSSWESIEVKLDNWDKEYKGKKDEAKKMKEAEKKVEKDNEPEEKKEEDIEDAILEEEEEDIEEEYLEEEGLEEITTVGKTEGEKLPIEFKSFAEKHPILGRIPFLGKLVDKINENRLKNKKTFEKEELSEGEVEDVFEEPSEGEVEDVFEEPSEDSKKDRDNDFKKYLREVAEKGMEGMEKEKKASVRERYEEMKARAQNPNRYTIDENGVKRDNYDRTDDDGR